jgi:phosphoribosyl 1,2-cyclic phosphodiesterase
LLRFASLASGSGGNCTIAEARDATHTTRVMIDCGLNLTDCERRLGKLGLLPSDIDGIFVTHEHGDHADGVFNFAASHCIQVFVTYGCLEAMKGEGKVLDGVKVQIISSRNSVTLEGMEIHPFTVPHDAREPVQYVVGDGASKLGILTDIGASTVHVEEKLSGLDALVLECNYDADMLWAGAYPKWLKQRIAGPFGHLDNRQSERLLSVLDRSRLKHVIGAHLSRQNNKPELARAALARAMDCEESWISLATQEDGFGWRELIS